MVAEGKLDPAGRFLADTVLAKHDENYMPPEVAKALKEQGVWKEPGQRQRAEMNETSPNTVIPGRHAQDPERRMGRPRLGGQTPNTHPGLSLCWVGAPLDPTYARPDLPMIIEIGHFALILALGVALVQATFPPAWGARAGDAPLMAVGEPAALAQLGLITLAFLALTHAYVTSDSVETVWANRIRQSR